jgi:hypothetical protein
VGRIVDWLFRDPGTGKLVIVQAPNLPLAVFLVATVVDRFGHPHGSLGTAVSAVSGVALAWWAGDEVLRGASRFRRVLGGAVLVAILIRLLV